jgi:hypothetical protein
MQPDLSRIWAFLVAALVVWLVYRRFRRNFGQQPLRPAAMRARIVILLIVGCLLTPAALRSNAFLLATLSGVMIGVVLALWGARRTRFLRIGNQIYYVPHSYTGAVISLLFLGRIVYRLFQVYGQMPAGQLGALGAARNPSPLGMVNSPLTLGLYFVLMGYYVCYYAIVLRNSKSAATEQANA